MAAPRRRRQPLGWSTGRLRRRHENDHTTGTAVDWPPPWPETDRGEVGHGALWSIPGHGGGKSTTHEEMRSFVGTDRRVEELVGELAARQHGLVTRAQLLESGMGADGVQYRVETKRLIPVHRGVYRVGPLIAANAADMA